LDPDGKPIDGAKVFLASLTNGCRIVAETKSDNTGHYEFRNTPLPIRISRSSNSSNNGRFQVFGAAEGFGFTWRPEKWFYVGHKPATGPEPGLEQPRHFSSNDKIELDLHFMPAARLRGQVIDAANRPIPNARVQIRYADLIPPAAFDDKDPKSHFSTLEGFNAIQWIRTDVSPEIRTRATDAEGRFEYANLPPDRRFVIRVSPSDFTDRNVFATTSSRLKTQDGEPVEHDNMVISFAKTVEVPVQVLHGDDGDPAPNVLVQCGNKDLAVAEPTDAQGRAVLRLAPGEYGVRLTPAAGQPYQTTLRESKLLVGPQPPQSPTLMWLRPAGVVDITVLDADTGKGVAGMEFATEDSDGAWMTPTSSSSWDQPTRTERMDPLVTDGNGKVQAYFPTGKHAIEPATESYQENYRRTDARQEFDCRPGQPVELIFHVRKQQ
jgi:hypothetical protein